MEDDYLDVAATPRCTTCGTLMRDAGPGYRCATCGTVVVIELVDAPSFDGPTIHGG